MDCTLNEERRRKKKLTNLPRVCVCVCVCVWLCVTYCVYVRCGSLTGIRNCATKCRGDCLRSFVFLFWPPIYKSIYYRTHQKVIKTLNNVINCSMKHEMSMAYVRIYTQQSLSVHKLSSNHQNMKSSKTFYNSQFCWWLSKTNNNSCQAQISVNFTNVAPAHSRIQYCQIFGIIL